MRGQRETVVYTQHRRFASPKHWSIRSEFSSERSNDYAAYQFDMNRMGPNLNYTDNQIQTILNHADQIIGF